MADSRDPFLTGKAPITHFYHQYIPSKFRIFCEGSSIRGMQKISKSPTTFLRILWSIFVFFMTTGLLIFSGFLVADYLNYHTAWHTTTSLDYKTDFPAISLCSHNPFSVKANDIWGKNETMTPTEFQSMLTNISMRYSATRADIGSFVLYDKAENYYVNLDFEDSLKLGHDRDMIYYCMLTTAEYSTVAKKCQVEAELDLTMVRFSHRQFFNCWTIQGKHGMQNFGLESIIMLVALTPSDDITEMRENFVMDMLTQGEGLRLVVHEQNTYPDIDKNGINVQPGKMNEIIYQPVRWNRMSNPTRPCKDNQLPIHDLDRVFNYSFPQCLDARLQQLLTEECGCMNNLWPRNHIPPNGKPYCLNTMTEERVNALPGTFECFGNFITKVKQIKEEAQKTVCFPRCNFYTYETTLSVTTWKPSKYKLSKLSQIYSATNTYFTNTNNTAIRNNYIQFLKKKDPLRDNFSSDSFHIFEENRFTYVSLNRKNPDATIKVEKLVLDIYILVSRIGGLCSLCIGLTTAFFIELIEFVYLSFHVERQRKNTLVVNTGAADGAAERECCQATNASKRCPARPGAAEAAAARSTAGQRKRGRLRSKFLPNSQPASFPAAAARSLTCGGGGGGGGGGVGGGVSGGGGACGDNDFSSPWQRFGNNSCDYSNAFKEQPVSSV